VRRIMLGVGGSADDRRRWRRQGAIRHQARKHASARESGQDLGVSHHYGCLWIRGCIPRNWRGSRRMWCAARTATTARSGWAPSVGTAPASLLGTPRRRRADHGARQPLCPGRRPGRGGIGTVGACTALSIRVLVYSRSMTTRVSWPLRVCCTARISGCLGLDGGCGSRVIS
jgi:hypothetical protein